MRRRSADLARVLAIAILCASSAPLAHAQIGSGWRQDFPSKTIQLRGPGTTYNNSGGIETFTMKSGDERSEMRVQNDYTSGQHQFEGWLRASYGQNYDRLVALKTKYDPENLFRMNLNIAPRA